MRADQLLLQLGLVPTRSAAQRLIERNAVRWLGPKGWAVVNKAGLDVPEGCEIEITDDAELRFVSRGGLKLEGALKACAIDVTGLDCLDVGQSTGGFTDALLQAGAKRVVGIDVGHGQLHPKLAADPRVSSFEGVNARDVKGSAFEAANTPHSFGFGRPTCRSSPPPTSCRRWWSTSRRVATCWCWSSRNSSCSRRRSARAASSKTRRISPRSRPVSGKPAKAWD